MKTTNNFRALLAGLLFLCVALPQAKAQLASPYVISNGTTCGMNITYQLYNGSCSPVGTPVSVTLPFTGYSFTPPAGAAVIEIVVNSLGTCPVTQVPASTGSGCTFSSSSSLTVIGSCNCTLSTINVTATGASIN